MQRAATVETLLSDPVGHYFVGATHVVWCASPTLCGSLHWGRPTARDAHELTRLYELARHPALASGFDVVMDDRAVELVEWGALGVLSDYVRGRTAEWRGVIRRQAVMVPSGVVGLMLAGVTPLVGIKHPIRFFSQRGEALDWLGRDDARVAVEEMERAADDARGIPSLVRALRQHLERSLSDASVEAAAASLGLSPRSLQRELRRTGTRFSAELVAARVRAACALLEDTEEKIEIIARRVGCASSSQLSAIFRQQLGETPARYRARRRSAAETG